MPLPQPLPTPTTNPSVPAQKCECAPEVPEVTCRFQPIQIIQIPVKTFIACNPISKTPIFGSRVVSCVQGTQEQVTASFEAIANLQGSACSPPTVKAEFVDVPVKVFAGCKPRPSGGASSGGSSGTGSTGITGTTTTSGGSGDTGVTYGTNTDPNNPNANSGTNVTYGTNTDPNNPNANSGTNTTYGSSTSGGTGTTGSTGTTSSTSTSGGSLANSRVIVIKCVKGEEAVIQQMFDQLFEIQAKQCEGISDSRLERIYKILGGDSWFGSGNEPKRRELFDSNFKSLAKSSFDPKTGKEKESESRNLLEWLRNSLGSTYFRTGIHDFPTEVNQTLTTYSDSESKLKIEGFAQYIAWFIQQFDLLVGQFPIELEIEDVDPLTKGDQKKRVEIPNLSEALAELYGLALTGSVNADVGIQFLMRLAAEVIATKNATLITQDYAKANASFLGYRGNAKKHEIEYAFNPTKLDSLEDFLQNSKAYIVGWAEEDKETVVGFLQRLMFSAGIIKSVFMRDKKLIGQLNQELAALVLEDPKDEEQWRKFLERFNNPENIYNTGVKEGQYPQSTLDKKPVEPDKEEPKKDEKKQ